jgi:DNA-binding XRE family transcriptional regulator
MSVREIRAEMGLSQSELGGLVGISSRAIQSYEQEWRQPSELVQRMLLLLLVAHRNGARLSRSRCWEREDCPPGVRKKCIAYAARQGHLCWFLTGTMCRGQRQKSWSDKLRLCLDCRFMQELLRPVKARPRAPTTSSRRVASARTSQRRRTPGVRRPKK